MILDKLFPTKSRILILREIALSKEGISISDIARKIKISRVMVSRIVKNLEEEGLIKSRIIGKVKLLRLNKEIAYSRDVIDLFRWELSLQEDMISVIAKELSKKYKKYVSIILFGSRARGEEKIDSDFDVMIIFDNVKKEVKSEFIHGFLVSIFKISKKDFIKRLKDKDPLISNVFVDGKVLKGAKNYETLIRQSKF